MDIVHIFLIYIDIIGKLHGVCKLGGYKVLSVKETYKILIEYSDFNCSDIMKYFNGMTELEFTGEELYEAVITCGMPFFYLTRNTFKKREEEIIYKIYLLNTALKVDQGYLVFSDKMDYLDSTERGYLNYYVGMFITKLVSSKIFGFDYLVHLSIAKRYMSIKFNSKKQPDLIAFNIRDDCYSIFEAKGRTRLDARMLKTAKEQVQAIKWISGSRHSNGIVSAVHPFDGIVKCHLKDPETKEKNNFDISKIRLIWLYYEPIYLLLKESNEEYNSQKDEKKEMQHNIQIEKNMILTISMPSGLYDFLNRCNFENIILEETENEDYKDKEKINLEKFRKAIEESEYSPKIKIESNI